jgi:hypothetical protein
MGLLDWVFASRKLAKTLYPEKRVVIHGVPIIITKLNPLSYVQGAQALTKVYDLYQKQKDSGELNQGVIDKIQKHYIDVFMSGVLGVMIHGRRLELSRKPVEPGDEDKKLFVKHLLNDWEFAEELYSEITLMTYGKKKMNQLKSQRGA